MAVVPDHKALRQVPALDLMAASFKDAEGVAKPGSLTGLWTEHRRDWPTRLHVPEALPRCRRGPGARWSRSSPVAPRSASARPTTAGRDLGQIENLQLFQRQPVPGRPGLLRRCAHRPANLLAAAELAMSAPRSGRGVLFDVAMSGAVSASLAPACSSPAPAAACLSPAPAAHPFRTPGAHPTHAWRGGPGLAGRRWRAASSP